jgi:hypothetical protein
MTADTTSAASIPCQLNISPTMTGHNISNHIMAPSPS